MTRTGVKGLHEHPPPRRLAVTPATWCHTGNPLDGRSGGDTHEHEPEQANSETQSVTGFSAEPAPQPGWGRPVPVYSWWDCAEPHGWTMAVGDWISALQPLRPPSPGSHASLRCLPFLRSRAALCQAAQVDNFKGN